MGHFCGPPASAKVVLPHARRHWTLEPHRQPFDRNAVHRRFELRAVIVVLSALLSVAQVHAEEFTDAPSPQAPATRLDKTLRIFAWPAYSFGPQDVFANQAPSKLDRAEEFVLAGERLGFLADATTTDLGFGPAHESNPMNTLWGSNNRMGVISSMTAWELGFSYTSVIVPRWFDHTRFRKAARIAAIAGGTALTGFRVKSAMQNAQFVR